MWDSLAHETTKADTRRRHTNTKPFDFILSSTKPTPTLRKKEPKQKEKLVFDVEKRSWVWAAIYKAQWFTTDSKGSEACYIKLILGLFYMIFLGILSCLCVNVCFGGALAFDEYVYVRGKYPFNLVVDETCVC